LEEHSVKREIRDAWVKALRSGDYAQGKQLLHYVTEHEVERFCCLGVLSDLAFKSGIVTKESFGTNIYAYRAIASYVPLTGNITDPNCVLQSQCDLIAPIREWANLLDGYQIGELVKLNDVGISFDVISDCIENNIIIDED
jgi:hypothetical protein